MGARRCKCTCVFISLCIGGVFLWTKIRKATSHDFVARDQVPDFLENLFTKAETGRHTETAGRGVPIHGTVPIHCIAQPKYAAHILPGSRVASSAARAHPPTAQQPAHAPRHATVPRQPTRVGSPFKRCPLCSSFTVTQHIHNTSW